MRASATNRFQGHFDYGGEYDEEEDNNEREFNEDEGEILLLPLNGEFHIEDGIQCS